MRENEQPFLVSKSFHLDECIFEYAICEDCHHNLSEEFSEQSRQALARFFQSHTGLMARSEKLHGNWQVESWVERCAFCDSPREVMGSYSIGGLFMAEGILFDPYPLCICSKCEEQAQECISKATRDIWDDFLASHFDGPPAQFQDLPVGGQPPIF